MSPDDELPQSVQANFLVRKYSDRLLMFRARALLPEKYRDKTKLEHSGAVDSDTVRVVFDPGWYGNDAHER